MLPSCKGKKKRQNIRYQKAETPKTDTGSHIKNEKQNKGTVAIAKRGRQLIRLRRSHNSCPLIII